MDRHHTDVQRTAGNPGDVAAPHSVEGPESARAPGVRTNAEWIEDLQAGDARSREEAVRELRDYVRSGLGRTFGADRHVDDSDLDDFAHDAIVRVLGSLDSFRGDSRFTTWAMAIAIRVGYTALRRRRFAAVSLEDIHSRGVAAVPAPSSAAPNPSRDAERRQVLEVLHTAIFECLTERQRTVILAELHGVASARLADLLGTNRNALYKVYHDARKKLRRAMIEAGFRSDEVLSLWGRR